jgi:hypothetical protein
MTLWVAGRCSVASAQDAGADLLRLGREAYSHKDYEAARVALAHAYALDPKASTLLELGLAELESDHPVEATQHLREYLTHTEVPAEKLTAVRSRWLPRAEAQTSQIEVTAPAGAEVLVDDVVQGRAPLGPILVRVGSHEVASREGTSVEKQTVSAKGGDVLDLRFQPVGDTVVGVPSGGPSAAAAVDHHGAWTEARSKSVTVIALATGAAVVFGVGIGFGITSDHSASEARSLSGQLDPDPSGSACTRSPTPTQCGPLAQAIQRTNDQHALSVGFELGGGVLAAGAVATWLLWHPRSPQVGGLYVDPVLSARGAGLALGSDW